jgi:hypothetical protein
MKDTGWRELSESLAFGGIPMRQQKKPLVVKKTLEEWFEEVTYPPEYKEFFPVVYIEKDDNYLKVGWIRICNRANEIRAEKGCDRRMAMRWSLAECFFEERDLREP